MSGGQRGGRRAAWLLTGAIAAVAAGLFGWALPATVRFLPAAPDTFWVMVLLGVLVDVPLFAFARRAGQPVRTTLSACFTFAIFLRWGAEPAIVVQAVAATFAAVTQRYPARGAIFQTSRLVCALAAAELVVALAGGRALARRGGFLTSEDVVGFVLPVGAWFLVSFGVLLLARAAIFGGIGRAAGDLREDILATTASMLLVTPLLTTLNGWWTAFVIVPLLALSQLTRLFAQYAQWLRREPVTGLLNRNGLIFGLEALTAEDRLDPLRPRPIAIALVNVESVLAANRRFGRDIYERLVAAAGARLAGVFGPDLVGRLSGEGFVVLLPDRREPEALAEAERAVAALVPTIQVDGIPFALDPAVGVALSPEHGRDFVTLVSRAELAMRQARRRGDRSAVYVAQAQAAPQRRIAMVSELYGALTDPARHHEIAVLYQPQVHLASGRLAGAEALVRWTHPEWGPVRTEELLETVEPTDVMHVLTRHILRRAIAQVADWNARGLRVRVAVNASLQDLHAPEFVDDIRNALAAHDVAPTELTIEITERMLVGDVERISQVARTIVGLGVGLSLDDFGTGYASVQQLRQLPLTEVKIDKSYVVGITGNPAERAIVTTVHHLARALGLAVVAEGVEDARTARQLAHLPGTIGQGWYFGRPVTAAVFEERWHNAPVERRRAGARLPRRAPADQA